MAFCTQCGQRQIEGEVHVCQEIAAGSTGVAPIWNGGGTASTPKGPDYNTVLKLVKNPESAMGLQPDKDFVSGLLGIAASLLGFVIWAWILNNKIVDMMDGIFGGFGGYDSFYDFSDTASGISSRIIGKVFLLGVISMVALIASLWLTGNWRGNRKLSAKEAVTYIGGMQYTFGIGFVIAGLCTLINLRLSFLVLLINLIAALTTSVIASTEISMVSRERRFSFIALSISIYFILFMLVTVIFI